MTRLTMGRLRFHVFHRGDADQDCHDHPWEFWTFPLRSYVEEVVDLTIGEEPFRYMRVVKAFQLHYRPATYTHRVMGKFMGWEEAVSIFEFVKGIRPVAKYEYYGLIPTIVWTRPKSRNWGFLKNIDGEWCWTPWRKYLKNKYAPCNDGDN